MQEDFAVEQEVVVVTYDYVLTPILSIVPWPGFRRELWNQADAGFRYDKNDPRDRR